MRNGAADRSASADVYGKRRHRCGCAGRNRTGERDLSHWSLISWRRPSTRARALLSDTPALRGMPLGCAPPSTMPALCRGPEPQRSGRRPICHHPIRRPTRHRPTRRRKGRWGMPLTQQALASLPMVRRWQAARQWWLGRAWELGRLSRSMSAPQWHRHLPPSPIRRLPPRSTHRSPPQLIALAVEAPVGRPGPAWLRCCQSRQSHHGHCCRRLSHLDWRVVEGEQGHCPHRSSMPVRQSPRSYSTATRRSSRP